MGVDSAGNKDEGAGDQGIMFGYACTETEALMPAPIYYAHLVLRRIAELRRNGDVSVAGLQPDAKSQVTLTLCRMASRWAAPASSSRPSMTRA